MGWSNSTYYNNKQTQQKNTTKKRNKQCDKQMHQRNTRNGHVLIILTPQVELTARRTLSFLSGGELVPLLGDILYPSEKELLAER